MDFLHESFNNADITGTAEKFLHMKDELLPFLFENLHKICLLEDEIYLLSEKYVAEKPTLGIPRHIVHPKDKEMWADYRKRYREIVEPICTETLLKRGVAQSFAEPAEYDYIHTGCKKIFFIMKSKSRAVVEIHYKHGVKKMHQFVLQLKEDGWKISSKNYGYPRPGEIDKWHVSTI